MQKQDKDKIAIITVLYNPTHELQLRLSKIISSMLLKDEFICILVDNSNNISRILSEKKGSYYIPNSCNLGIARAQNIALEKARELKCKYAIFFDQDSEYNIEFIIKLIDEYKKIKLLDRTIAVLGPIIVDKVINRPYKSKILQNTPYTSVDTIISSGSVMEVSTFNEVGNMDDDLFIDLVDHEWCWRAKSLGYTCYQTSCVMLNHKVGNCNKALLGFPIIISAPFRYYYKYRNFFWMLRRPYVPLKWKVKESIRKLVEFICVPIIRKKISIYHYMFNGVKDGLIKK